MSLEKLVAGESTKRAPVAASEVVWLFESNLDGRHARGAAAIAVKCHGAERGKCNGAAGSSYALPTRDEENTLLPWDRIGNNVRNHTFRVLPGSEGKTEEEHARYADLFRDAPANCELPGRWLKMLGRLNTARIIVLDANVPVVETGRKRVLDNYFSANEGLWNVEQVEIISLGSARTLVANDKYAKGRGYRHRIINVDTKFYGDYTPRAREQLSVAYATELVCLNDPTGTSTGNQMGAVHLASCAGLPIDELLLQQA
jgi:hypothetical protein